MSAIVESVVQRSPDGAARIVRRQHARPVGVGGRSYVNYVVELLVDGAWERSRNGPWDYLANARAELRRSVNPPQRAS